MTTEGVHPYPDLTDPRRPALGDYVHAHFPSNIEGEQPSATSKLLTRAFTCGDILAIDGKYYRVEAEINLKTSPHPEHTLDGARQFEDYYLSEECTAEQTAFSVAKWLYCRQHRILNSETPVEFKISAETQDAVLQYLRCEIDQEPQIVLS